MADLGAPLADYWTISHHSLPVHLTSFVGREVDLAVLRALLRDQRLVTLTGVGGAGKSRLAVQIAAEQAEQWPDGVWWVELGSVLVGSELAKEVASALDTLVEPRLGPLRSLAAQLRDRRTLVCLDNCEHVLDAAAEVTATLLSDCPRMTVLTTSREPLGLAGEAVWQVPPLGETDALRLFVERATLVSPGFTLDATNEAAVRAMCTRLDGIPLALELAAAWARTLTPRQIEAGLDDRFVLLVRGPRGVAPRQQTLAASIDWSHALLEEPDQVVFRRLAVFPDGFSLEAARSVCAADDVDRDVAREAIGRLVDKSLVVADVRRAEARYRLLETIRHYAADHLAQAGDVVATRDRHLGYFLDFAEHIEPRREQDLDAWRTRLEVEYDNLRVALDWGLAATDSERGRRLAAALAWLWHLDSHGREGLDYLQRAIRRAPGQRSSLQAHLLTGLALVADTASPVELENDAAQQALEIATEVGDQQLRALCLELSAIGQFYTDFAKAWELIGQALNTARAVGDEFVVDGAQALQGIILHLRDRHTEAEPLLAAAVPGLLQRHRGVAATTLGYQAVGALYTGEIELAQRLAEQAVAVAEPLGDYLRVGSTRAVLALVHGFRGEVDAGLECMTPVLRLIDAAESSSRIFVPGLAHVMGWLHLWRADAASALAWFEGESTGDTWLAAQTLPGLGAAQLKLGRADDARCTLDRAVSLARRLDLPRVLADALEQQANLTDVDRAIELHHEALSVRVDRGLRTQYVDSLEALAALAEPTPEIVRVLSGSETARGVMGYPRDPRRQTAYRETVDRLRATLGDQVVDRAWAEGTDLALEQAVAYVRRSRGARKRPATGWNSLTPTELEVVQLVVDGLNNPAVGARLFMSRGTVKTHLSHVFNKLGVSNRTELATAAAARLQPPHAPAPGGS